MFSRQNHGWSRSYVLFPMILFSILVFYMSSDLVSFDTEGAQKFEEIHSKALSSKQHALVKLLRNEVSLPVETPILTTEKPLEPPVTSPEWVKDLYRRYDQSIVEDVFVIAYCFYRQEDRRFVNFVLLPVV